MQFVLGALSVVCLGLIVVWAWLVVNLNRRFAHIDTNLEEVLKAVAKIPAPVTNVIHLGLRKVEARTGLIPASLSLRPEDFQVQADKLYVRLTNGLRVKNHPDVGVNAYCILKHAGLDHILDGPSWREAQEALTRLLNNEDDEATKRFLRTLADSVANPPIEPAPETPLVTR
ncbi:MAG: hypothetical protein AAB758_01005 [Patescibacteria group bacterium]